MLAFIHVGISCSALYTGFRKSLRKVPEHAPQKPTLALPDWPVCLIPVWVQEGLAPSAMAVVARVDASPAPVLRSRGQGQCFFQDLRSTKHGSCFFVILVGDFSLISPASFALRSGKERQREGEGPHFYPTAGLLVIASLDSGHPQRWSCCDVTLF